MSETTSGFNPLNEKRFILPKNEVARPRLETLRKTVKEVTKTHPEVLGFTLFGSMSKGKATEKSDIDGFLFIDLDKMKTPFTPQELQKGQEKLAQYKLPPLLEDTTALVRYKSLLTEPLKKLGMTDEQLDRDMRVRVLSKKIVGDELKKIVENAQLQLEFEKKLEAFDKWNTEHPQERRSYVEWSDQNPRPELHNIDWRISAMFHLAIGNGIKEYRNQVIDYLAKFGEVGDKAWSRIIDGTSTMERFMSGTSYSKFYPKNIAEAQKYYQTRGKKEVTAAVGGMAMTDEPESRTGGLAIMDEKKPDSPIESPAHFDPMSLLNRSEIPLEELFSLDKDNIYTTFHRLQSLPVGNPNREKALKILLALEQGKDTYLQTHSGQSVLELEEKVIA